MHRDDLLLFGEGMSSEGVRYEAFNVHGKSVYHPKEEKISFQNPVAN